MIERRTANAFVARCESFAATLCDSASLRLSADSRALCRLLLFIMRSGSFSSFAFAQIASNCGMS